MPVRVVAVSSVDRAAVDRLQPRRVVAGPSLLARVGEAGSELVVERGAGRGGRRGERHGGRQEGEVAVQRAAGAAQVGEAEAFDVSVAVVVAAAPSRRRGSCRGSTAPSRRGRVAPGKLWPPPKVRRKPGRVPAKTFTWSTRPCAAAGGTAKPAGRTAASSRVSASAGARGSERRDAPPLGRHFPMGLRPALGNSPHRSHRTRKVTDPASRTPRTAHLARRFARRARARPPFRRVILRFDAGWNRHHCDIGQPCQLQNTGPRFDADRNRHRRDRRRRRRGAGRRLRGRRPRGGADSEPARGEPSVDVVSPRNGARQASRAVVVKLEIHNFRLAPLHFGGEPQLGEGQHPLRPQQGARLR